MPRKVNAAMGWIMQVAAIGKRHSRRLHRRFSSEPQRARMDLEDRIEAKELAEKEVGTCICRESICDFIGCAAKNANMNTSGHQPTHCYDGPTVCVVAISMILHTLS